MNASNSCCSGNRTIAMKLLIFLCFLQVVVVDAGAEPPEPPDEPTLPMPMLGICLPSAEKTLVLTSFRSKWRNKSNTLTAASIRSSSASCIEALGNDIGVVVQRGKHFWLDGERTTDTGDTFPTRTFFISRSPKNHLILVTCDTANSIDVVNKRCTGELKVDIIVSDPPNNVDWYKIEKTLRKSIRVKLTDSRNNFLYLGNECHFDNGEEEEDDSDSGAINF